MAGGYDLRPHSSKFTTPSFSQAQGIVNHFCQSAQPIANPKFWVLPYFHIPSSLSFPSWTFFLSTNFPIGFMFPYFRYSFLLWTPLDRFPTFPPRKNHGLSRLGSEAVRYDSLCFNQAMCGISWRGTLQLLRSMKLWLSWGMVGELWFFQHVDTCPIPSGTFTETLNMRYYWNGNSNLPIPIWQGNFVEGRC